MEDRFYYQDLDRNNLTDLLRWAADDELVGLVDEVDGGIIGYINRAHIEKVISILNKQKVTV